VVSITIMTDIVIRNLSESEYEDIQIAYVKSKKQNWKEFILEMLNLWNQQLNQ